MAGGRHFGAAWGLPSYVNIFGYLVNGVEVKLFLEAGRILELKIQCILGLLTQHR